MLSEKQKARLNPEQLKIAEIWEDEHDKRSLLIEQLGKADKVQDLEKCKQLIEAIEDTVKTFCEHGKSIWCSCAACDEIEKLLNPEYYCTICGERFPLELDKQNCCEYCRK